MAAGTLPAMLETVCQWLRQQISDAQLQGAVLEMDGSINAVIAGALAQRACGEQAVGLTLSCHTPADAIESAVGGARYLGLRHETIDLSGCYDELLQLLPGTPPARQHIMASRLRSLVLDDYAKTHQLLVVGTLSRSHWETGSYTRHADDAADLFPLLQWTQSELEEIARFWNFPEPLLQSTRLFSQPQGSKIDWTQCGFSLQELDAYLAGKFPQVPDAVRARIQSRRQLAFQAQRPVSERALWPPAAGIDPIPAEDQEVLGRSLEALTLISKAITSEEYLSDILRLIVMVTAEVMNSSVCSLWLLDEKEGVLRLGATQSIDREYLQDRVLKVGEGVVGKVVAEKRPYLVAHVLEDPFFKEKELARRMGLVSMLSMPMRVKDRVIGVINCYTSHPHVFSDLQTNVLTTVANQAAVAIEKTELMVQTKVIQEELAARKLIERAKDLLMKRLDLSGEDAYRWLQKRSMNMRRSMREVAEAVLLTMEN